MTFSDRLLAFLQGGADPRFVPAATGIGAEISDDMARPFDGRASTRREPPYAWDTMRCILPTYVSKSK
jgi:hypothetical protein